MKYTEYDTMDQYDYLDGKIIEQKFHLFSVLIGRFLIKFSCLEHELNVLLSDSFVDDMHELGYIIIENMNMATKIDLFYKNFFYHKAKRIINNTFNKLRSINSFRNIIVHANWKSLTKDGFLRTKITFDHENGHIKFRKVKISKRMIEQEIASVERIINRLYSLQT